MTSSVLVRGSGILAHQSTRDEFVLFALPVLLVLLYLGLRWWNTRRSADDAAASDTADPDRRSD